MEDHMIGATISHYRIIEKLGEGGMGVVYKAQDTRLDRPVALKFLPPDLTRDSEARERFIHEAKAASALQHPNICTIHDIDETADNQLFIVMDCYEGETLKSRIANGQLRIDEALDIAAQVAQGLAKAHESGIIHRDIKPGNIIVSKDGIVRIVDFGLAKLAGQTVLTKTGRTLGTVAYMSPEQARGEQVDQRTDIWSLGAVLYEMLTGKRPFESEYEQALVYSILNAQPKPMQHLRPELPEALETICRRAMAKDPSERYQHATELIKDLDAFKSGTVISARTKRVPVRVRRLAYAAAGLIALALIAYFLVPREEVSSSRLKKITVSPFRNLGPAADGYFAEGLTTEITSRLIPISKVALISLSNPTQDKDKSRTLAVVAKELGVDYLLNGTVRWDKTESKQKIRITPELIRLSDGRILWSEGLDGTLDSIFVLQTAIATRVVKYLDILLSADEKNAIEAIPTKNLEAYDAYLRTSSYPGYDRPDAERRMEMLQRAVELDSTFALVYTMLSGVHLTYFWFGWDPTNERLAMAKACIDKALALDHELPQAYYALGRYYFQGFRNYDRALEALSTAEKKLPNSSAVAQMIGFILRRQGNYEAAAERLRKAFELTPQSANIAYEIGTTLAGLGMYAEADEYLDRSISLRPSQDVAYLLKAAMYLRWLGDTKKSRSVLELVPAQYPPVEDLAWLNIYERDYESALDRLAQDTVRTFVKQSRLTPVSQLRGLIYTFMDDPAHSRASFDSARVFLESEIKKRPDDNRLHSSLGIVYAGLGRSEEAVREAELAVKQLPISVDAWQGVHHVISLAQVYTMVGKYDAALEKLEFLLSLHAPKLLTAQILRLDPIYDPLRSNPRFQALMVKVE